MTVRRRLIFVLATLALAVALPAAVLLAVDIHLHTKYQTSAGFNIWGYRGPAFLRARHIEQQREAAAMLARVVGDPRVRSVNFGDTIDLTDPALSFDHMHLTAAGDQRFAERLAGPVMEMASRRLSAPSEH